MGRNYDFVYGWICDICVIGYFLYFMQGRFNHFDLKLIMGGLGGHFLGDYWGFRWRRSTVAPLLRVGAGYYYYY